MKRCEYCDCLNADDAVVCASCGGGSFRYRCVNCETEFKEGRICPSCGVAVGQQQKRCPRCKASYDTLACPTCGYTPEWKAPSAFVPQSAFPEKKRQPLHLWLWVLGWLFFPAVPATVLVARSKRIPKWLKAVLILLI